MFNTKKMLLLAGPALAVAATTIVSAVPVSAAVPGLQIVSVETVANSNPVKTATVSCPPGKQVVGAGGAIIGAATGLVMLEDVTPLPNLSGVNVVAAEIGYGTGVNWSLRAYATCANPLPGLQLVSAESPINSTSKGLAITCPAGKKVVGVGGQVNVGASGWVGLQRLKIESATKVRIRASETGFPGEGANWSVKGYAICANPLPGHEVVSATSANDSSDVKSITRFCTGSKKMLGYGGDVENSDQRAVLDEILPVPSMTAVNVISSESLGGTVSPWVAKTFAVCANA